VLKGDGVFCGCFYVSGLCRRTDWFIRRVYQPLKLFVPPYETPESLETRLRGMFERVELSHVKGMACFVCCQKRSGV